MLHKHFNSLIPDSNWEHASSRCIPADNTSHFYIGKWNPSFCQNSCTSSHPENKLGFSYCGGWWSDHVTMCCCGFCYCCLSVSDCSLSARWNINRTKMFSKKGKRQSVPLWWHLAWKASAFQCLSRLRKNKIHSKIIIIKSCYHNLHLKISSCIGFLQQSDKKCAS